MDKKEQFHSFPEAVIPLNHLSPQWPDGENGFAEEKSHFLDREEPKSHPSESAECQLCPHYCFSVDMPISEATWAKSTVSSADMDGVDDCIRNSQTSH